MRKLSNLFCFVLISSFFAGMISCTDSTEPAEEAKVPEVKFDSAAAVNDINTLRNTFIEMVSSGNYEQMGEVVHPDFSMVGPNGPQWDSLRSYATGGPYPAGTTLNIQPEKIMILNNSWAWETGNTEAEYSPEGAEEPMVLNDTYLIIFKNEGNGWRIYREVAAAMY